MEEEEKKDGELKINPIFEPLFEDNLNDPRYYQVYGGRGSGKSFSATMAGILKTYSNYKHKVLFLRQVMASSEDSTIADVRAGIAMIGKQADFRESKGQIINITTGSTISFKGIRSTGNQTAKLKSLSGITTLIIEEAEEVESFAEFSKVDESIRIIGKPLKIILVYNPTSAIASWIHKEWFVKGIPNVARFSDTVYLHSTYKDNLKNLNASVIARYESLKDSNPTYYTNTILAEWTIEAAGRVYDGWGHYPYFDEDGDVWYGLDFGYGGKDKTALIKVTWKDDRYYVEEMFCANLSLRETITKMRKLNIPFTAKIFADSAVPELITQIREGGFLSIRKATKGDKAAGIKKVQDKEIILVGDDSTELYFGYMTFARDSKGNLPHEPDALAAMRYAINSKKPSKNAKNPPPRKARRKGFL
ncbi:phage terminase large subunit [Cellulophaga phage phiST]|uniref:Phage large subunit terminase n=1 Tax=Cellulophaga phage phiST TaxID=756282 RepID=M4T1Q0_9CAUD|nr:terminase large subunit [Cellulophaga phage phiST]AGH56719.1 phage large subunit terminase [Cellulophaga phage phiST]AGO47229.1 phage terminase large subunit [Cellulophaga phage phiST]